MGAAQLATKRISKKRTHAIITPSLARVMLRQPIDDSASRRLQDLRRRPRARRSAREAPAHALVAARVARLDARHRPRVPPRPDRLLALRLPVARTRSA